MAATLADWMDGPGAAVPLADVAHTLNHHRARHNKFGTVVARDHTGAVAGLRALATGTPGPGVVGATRPPAGRARCSSTPARVRSGQAWAGSCWPRAGVRRGDCRTGARFR